MIVVIISSIIVVAVATFFWYYRTQTVWVKSEEYKRASSIPAKALVVVYSRTGNTMSAAKNVAKHFDADLLKIKAPQYARDFNGLKRASSDADEEVITTPIEHSPIDLSNYDFIILCTPTWWFRPAVPMFSFVENHDFLGKPVMLIMTGNSRKIDERTEKFKQLVEEKNGNLLDILFVKRGRIYWQKTPDEVNNEVLEAIKQRKSLWSDFITISDSN